MKKVFACVLLICGAPAAIASDVSYDFGQLTYISEHLDQYDCTQNGVSVMGNLELSEQFFVLGSVADVSGGVCGSTTLAAGGGYKFDATPDISVYTSLALSTTRVDQGDGDTGLVLAVGARGYVMEALEARAQLSHATAFDGATTLGAGANYWFNPTFAAVADVAFSSDSSAISLGVRMNF